MNYNSNNFDEKFNYYYSLLVKIKKQNESGKYSYSTNLTKNDKIKIDSEGIHVVKYGSPEYNYPGLINAGDWIYRYQSNFNENQRQMLREVGYVLQEDKNKKFDESKKKVDSLHHDDVIEMVECNKEAINVNRVS